LATRDNPAVGIMPEAMKSRFAGQPSPITGAAKDSRNRVAAERLSRLLVRREKIETRPLDQPILPQTVEQTPRKHHIALLIALGLVDENPHLLGIDIFDPQVPHLDATETAGVSDHENHSIPPPRRRVEEIQDLLFRKNHRQPTRTPRARHGLDGPCSDLSLDEIALQRAVDDIDGGRFADLGRIGSTAGPFPCKT